MTKYFAGECKFRNSPFSFADYLDLKTKINAENRSAEVYYALFSAAGFDERIAAEEDEMIMTFDLPQIVNG